MTYDDESEPSEWLKCPKCGNEEFDAFFIPDRIPGRNNRNECPECGHKIVVVG